MKNILLLIANLILDCIYMHAYPGKHTVFKSRNIENSLRTILRNSPGVALVGLLCSSAEAVLMNYKRQ